MSGEHFSLVWNSFPKNLSSGLYNLLTDEQLVDVTLAAEGQILRAHKLILSVCSTYFKDLFKENSCKHPIVILKDVNYRDLSAMLHFMYQGEVNIKQEDIPNFLKVAETLRIKGLTKETDENVEKVEDLENSCDIKKNKIESMDTDLQRSIEESTPQIIPPQHPPCQANSTEESDFNERRDSHEDIPRNKTHPVPNITKEYKTEEGEDYNFQPLDCSNEVGGTLLQPKTEKQDHVEDNSETETSDMDTMFESHNENVHRQDLLSAAQLTDYNESPVNESFGLNTTIPLQQDFTHTSRAKGRRTVKGIPNSCLPLEATLRVVSELGPTLRMERGKVMRMFSCPWCLRHFTRKENLKLHVRYIHGPLESLTCKLCGNKYKNSNSLRVHSYLYHNVKREKPNKTLISGGA